MKVKSAVLDTIAVRESQYPSNNKDEFLLTGRSNVGKSSFINALINRKKLAHISEKPGKTKTLNFYLINNAFYLVDVPGYGYASISKEKRMKFGLMIEEYISKRKELKRVFLLIDFRHKIVEDDLLMYKYLKYYQIPVTIIATKSDKISEPKRKKQLDSLVDDLDLAVGDNLILFSSLTKEGKEEVLDLIQKIVGLEDE